MTQLQSRRKSKNIFNRQLSLRRDKIKDDSLIFKEGYFDSMGFVVLITYLEENFGIKTSDSDLVEENFESINAITDFIVRKNSI